jgi:tRNA uridine 5-carbamoylmethylation protein Kti12
MKLIILYGPPAAGKLTIANELASIADIKVFDNHQVIDIIEPIVTRKYADFAKLIYDTQRSIIKATVKADQLNVVITFPYAANLEGDVDFLTELVNSTREQGSEAYPVFLTCDTEMLMKRVLEPSRKTYGKITTTEIMGQMIEMHDFDTPLQITGNATFNTKDMSAKDVATEIKKLAGL